MDRGSENRYGYRRIFEAAERSVDELKHFVEREGVSLRITNGAEQTLAHIAAKHNNVEVLEYVLEKEPRLAERKDIYRCSVLHLAVVRGAFEAVKYLVEKHDADICYLGGQYKDRTALHAAVEFNHLEILKYFVDERHIDYNTPNPKQTTPPLFLTVRHRNWDVIEYLVEEKKANVRQSNVRDESILFPIVRENFMSFLKYLLDEKRFHFDIDHRSRYGESLLHVAAMAGRVEMLKYLVEKKFAYVNAQKDTDKRTPLHYAAARDYIDACKYLIEQGANPCLEDYYGETAAQKARDPELVEYLEEAIKSRKPRSVASPYSLLQPVVALPVESTPQKSIAHTSHSVGLAPEVKSISAGNTNVSCFQSFLFLAKLIGRSARSERELGNAISFPSSTSVLQSRMSSIAIDAVNMEIDFRKF